MMPLIETILGAVIMGLWTSLFLTLSTWIVSGTAPMKVLQNTPLITTFFLGGVLMYSAAYGAALLSQCDCTLKE